MSIQGIKLITGEELVADCGDFGSNKVTVKNPLLLIMSNGPSGLVANFMPWTIIASGDIEIQNSAIVARYDVATEVEKNYIQNTTGLQIVSATPSQILQG